VAWGGVQSECWAIAVEMANHATDAGISAEAVIVAGWRQLECRMPRARMVTAAAVSAHCPIPPVVTQVCAVAHGAHEPEAQSNLSVQSDPIVKAVPNQPKVPRMSVTTRVTVTSAIILGFQFACLMPDAAFMRGSSHGASDVAAVWWCMGVRVR
jgi:hypothetical protein